MTCGGILCLKSLLVCERSKCGGVVKKKMLCKKKKKLQKKKKKKKKKKKNKKFLFRKCERLEVNKSLVVWLFKHIENKSQNCFVEHSGHFVFPIPSFLLTPNLWPHYTIESPYDLMICGLIVESWLMSKLMGTLLVQLLWE